MKKVYIAKTDSINIFNSPSGMMIYNHELGLASWGELFYPVPFEKIKKYWIYIGEF